VGYLTWEIITDHAFVKIRGGNEPQLLAALSSRKSIVTYTSTL